MGAMKLSGEDLIGGGSVNLANLCEFFKDSVKWFRIYSQFCFQKCKKKHAGEVLKLSRHPHLLFVTASNISQQNSLFYILYIFYSLFYLIENV